MEKQDYGTGRDIGRQAAQRIARAMPRPAQFSRTVMTVTAVPDNAHYDVDAGTAGSPMPIKGVQAITAAQGAKVGELVVVDVFNGKALVIGILPSNKTE